MQRVCSPTTVHSFDVQAGLQPEAASPVDHMTGFFTKETPAETLRATLPAYKVMGTRIQTAALPAGKVTSMTAILVLVLLLALFGGGGFVISALWYVLIAALVL